MNEALQESEEFSSNLLLNSPYPIVVINLDTSIRYVNPALEKLTGFSSSELVGGRAPYPWWTKETSEKASSDLREAMSGCPQRFEELFQRKNGQRFWVEITTVPVISNRQVKYYLANWVDITERKRVEQVLRESEKRYRAFFKTSRDCVYITRKDGSWVDFNDAAIELFGYKNGEELRKVKIPELYENPEERGKALQLIEQQNYIEDFVSNLRKKDGSRINASITAVVMKDESGNITGYQGIIKDMTQHKQVESKLVRLNKQLRNLSAHLQSIREEERSRIAREIHDELGQALTALKINIHWLGSRLAERHKTLYDKTVSMAKLIDTTLQTVKRISTELRPRLLDDLGIAAAIEWQAQEFQKVTGIKCKVIFDPQDIVLNQDCSTIIFRIFQETMTNVLRHANATRVAVSLERGDDKAVFQVSDNGKGITPEQISNPEALGLIGMRERAYSLGGDIKVSGVRNKGTTIRVTIPLSKEGQTDAENPYR